MGWVKALLHYVIWCGASSISIRKVSMGVSPMSLKKKRCSRHFRPMERRAGSRSSSLANLLKACEQTDVKTHLVDKVCLLLYFFRVLSRMRCLFRLNRTWGLQVVHPWIKITVGCEPNMCVLGCGQLSCAERQKARDLLSPFGLTKKTNAGCDKTFHTYYLYIYPGDYLALARLLWVLSLCGFYVHLAKVNFPSFPSSLYFWPMNEGVLWEWLQPYTYRRRILLPFVLLWFVHREIKPNSKQTKCVNFSLKQRTKRCESTQK